MESSVTSELASLRTRVATLEAEKEVLAKQLKERSAAYDALVSRSLQREQDLYDLLRERDDAHRAALAACDAAWSTRRDAEREKLLAEGSARWQFLLEQVKAAQGEQGRTMVHAVVDSLTPIRTLAVRVLFTTEVSAIRTSEESAREELIIAQNLMWALLSCRSEEMASRVQLLRDYAASQQTLLLSAESDARENVVQRLEAAEREQIVHNFYDFIYLQLPVQVLQCDRGEDDDYYVSGGVLFHITTTKLILLRQFVCQADRGISEADSLEHVNLSVYVKEGTFVGFDKRPEAWRCTSRLQDVTLYNGQSFLLRAGGIILHPNRQYSLFIKVDDRKILFFMRRERLKLPEDAEVPPEDQEPYYQIDKVAKSDGVVSITGCRWCARTKEFCEFAPQNSDVFTGSIHYYLL